jgi:hypothetical protein
MVTTFDGVEDAYSASGGRFDRSSARTARNIAEQNLGAIILAAHRFPQQKGTTHAQNHTPADS